MEEARTWSEILPAYKDRGLEMLMVSIDPYETEQSIEAFNNAAGVAEPLPTVINGGDIARRFGVSALETTIILGRDGEEVFRDAAITDAGTLRAELESAGVGQFVGYGLGMTSVLLVLTLSLAFFKRGVVYRLRGLVPYVQVLSATLLVLAGAYVILYWWPVLAGGA